MRADELVPVYEAPMPHAQVVAGALNAQGIPARVWSGHFETVAHPNLGLARVMVRAGDAAQARRLIEELES